MVIYCLKVSNKMYAGVHPDLFKICVDDLEDENVLCHIKFTLDTKLEGWSIYSKHGCHPDGPTQAAGIGLR